MTKTVGLIVNGNPITLDYFVEAFVHHTVSGMVAALEGTGPVHELTLTIDEDRVDLRLNGQPVPTNRFASRIIKSTAFGMIAPLKGVSDPKQFRLEMTGSP